MDQITQGLPGPASQTGPTPIAPASTPIFPQGNSTSSDKSKKLKIWGSVLGVLILAIVGFSVFYGKSILYPGKIPPPRGAGDGQGNPALMCLILNTEPGCTAVPACRWDAGASKCIARQGGGVPGGAEDAQIQAAVTRAGAAVQAAQTAANAAQRAANQAPNNATVQSPATDAQTAFNDAKAAFNRAKRAVTAAEAERAATEAEAARDRAVAAQHEAEAALAAEQETARLANERTAREAAMTDARTAAGAARAAATAAANASASAKTDVAWTAARAADTAADAAEAAVARATEAGTLDAANEALRTAQTAQQNAETAQAAAETELQRVRSEREAGGQGGGGGRGNDAALRNACNAFKNIEAEFITPAGEGVPSCKLAGQTYTTVDTLLAAASKECGTRQWTWNAQNSTCTNPADNVVGEFLRTCSEISGTSDAENGTCTYNGRTFQHNELAALREEKNKVEALALLKQICTDPAVMGDTACTLDGISFTEPDSLADYQTRKKECASKDQNDWEWVPGDKQCKNKRAQREQEQARQHEEEVARHAREEGEARGRADAEARGHAEAEARARAEAEANRGRDEIARLQQQLAQATSTNNDARIAELSQRIADLTTQMSQRSAAASPAPAPAAPPAPAPSVVAVVAPSPAAAPSTPVPTSPATAPAAASSSSSSASERVVALVTPKEAKEAQKNKPKTGEGKTSAAESAAGASTTSNNVASNTAGSATSGSAAASAATRAATQRLHGAFIQGKTGPEVMLYPVLIAGANGLYYFLRKRRKNKK